VSATPWLYSLYTRGSHCCLTHFHASLLFNYGCWTPTPQSITVHHESVIQLAHSTVTTQLAHIIDRGCWLCWLPTRRIGTLLSWSVFYTLTVLHRKLANGCISWNSLRQRWFNKTSFSIFTLHSSRIRAVPVYISLTTHRLRSAAGIDLETGCPYNCSWYPWYFYPTVLFVAESLEITRQLFKIPF